MKDLFKFTKLLNEEELLIRKTAADFVDKEILPYIEPWFEQSIFPRELSNKMGKLGFLGPTIPTEYGGSDASSLEYGLIMQQLERGDSGIRSFASVQGSLVMYPIFKYGSENQRRHWLPKLASGEAIGCFGLTEADFGSNPGGMLTQAENISDGYELNGTKMWITNGSLADVAVVWAKLEGEIRGFLVTKETPGFSAKAISGKWSLRASVTSELVFDQCRIPKENILPHVKGMKGPLSCLSQARFGIAWGAVGSAQAVFDAALDYANSRIQFGKPISAFQITQQKLADMYSQIVQAELLAYHAAKLKDSSNFDHTQISLVKRNNVHVAREAAKTARTILGANGISSEYPVMRHMMNLESVYTYEGTHDIHTLILGQYLTDQNAFL